MLEDRLGLFLAGKVWLDELLVFEELSCLALLLEEVLFGLVPHLVVNFNLILCHLDVFFNDADTFLFLGSLEAKVHLIVRLRATRTLRANRFTSHCPFSNAFLLFFFELVQLLIGLEVDLVLLIEMYFKADNFRD